MTYDYLTAIKNDVLDYIIENYTLNNSNSTHIYVEEYEDREELEEVLNNECWTADSVTGNGSGSYTFNHYQAEEYISHNLDLYFDACQEFGKTNITEFEPEEADVTIRCYLLSQAISELLDDIGIEHTIPLF